MTTFTDSYSLKNETLDEGARIAVNLGRSREFCSAMFDDGACGVEIIYAMTYVAVEAGLIQTGNGFYIFPRVAQAIADAGFHAKEKADEAVRDEAALVDDPSSNIVQLTQSPNIGEVK
jgi:hypothetical protein